MLVHLRVAVVKPWKGQEKSIVSEEDGVLAKKLLRGYGPNGRALKFLMCNGVL